MVDCLCAALEDNGGAESHNLYAAGQARNEPRNRAKASSGYACFDAYAQQALCHFALPLGGHC